MNDLISRQAAVDIVDFECGEWRGLAKTIIDEFEALPTVDALKVVRCKDCIWKYDHYCTRAVDIWISDEDFCSFAERKDNGQTT